MAKDNRSAPRAHHDSVLELLDSSGKLIEGIGRLVDVSRSGACFSSTTEFKVGARFTARLRLLSDGSHDFHARIVWIRKKNNAVLYGLEFEKLTP